LIEMTGDEVLIVEEGASLVCRDCGSSRVRDLIVWLRADDGTPIAEHHTCPQCGLRVGLEANTTGWRPFRLLVRKPSHGDRSGW
jgi:predicted RNA-binding Zn-ribbon protein involved in translation (DUF1610 family)